MIFLCTTSFSCQTTTTSSQQPPKRISIGQCPACGGIRYNKHVGRSGHLWGDRYGSCIIDTDEHYVACVRYIYQNPKRAGIVEDLEEFSESSFQFYAFGRKIDVVLVDDHLVLRLNGNKRKIGEYFRVLVLDEGMNISDEQVKEGPSSHVLRFR